MSQFWALLWPIKPGSKEAVEDAFRNYGRPDHIVKDDQGNEKGKLLATQVFMKDDIVVRIIEFEGEILDVAPHMARQPAIKELESKLDEHLAEPRDMSTPEGARHFFISTSMRCVLSRRHDE